MSRFPDEISPRDDRHTCSGERVRQTIIAPTSYLGPEVTVAKIHKTYVQIRTKIKNFKHAKNEFENKKTCKKNFADEYVITKRGLR